MRIAVDVMGGDYAPGEIIAGALKWAQKSDSCILLVGARDLIEKELKSYEYDPSRVNIVDAPEVIGMDESPVTAIRKKKNSSIVVATNLVKENLADAVVSCGSTGAQMAAALFILGRIEDIERPPIVASILNSAGSFSLLVDIGANVDCRPKQLLQFAVLGKVYASISLGIENPRVALLNNGEEENKGNSLSVEAYSLFREKAELNFVGNIEGRDLFSGKSDVIVCDGFTGNIVLKTIEGMAIFMAEGIARELGGKLPRIFSEWDYTRIGGAPLLGVNGVSIVCHGSSKREAVFSGINIAENCVKNGIVEKQKKALSRTV